MKMKLYAAANSAQRDLWRAILLGCTRPVFPALSSAEIYSLEADIKLSLSLDAEAA